MTHTSELASPVSAKLKTEPRLYEAVMTQLRPWGSMSINSTYIGFQSLQIMPTSGYLDPYGENKQIGFYDQFRCKETAHDATKYA